MVMTITEYQYHFNSHAHVERDECGDTSKECGEDFNSHAHVERDKEASPDEETIRISTHTLTWSVTLDNIFIF